MKKEATIIAVVNQKGGKDNHSGKLRNRTFKTREGRYF